jgi:hypothetical protein
MMLESVCGIETGVKLLRALNLRIEAWTPLFTTMSDDFTNNKNPLLITNNKNPLLIHTTDSNI